jgi:hypothetical protein
MSNELMQGGALTTKARPWVDWPAIERDYRAGILSLREIAGAHGITHGAVNKRAKRDGWSRDLAARIQARANELVSRAAVNSAVSTQCMVTDDQVVESNAMRIAHVRAAHRTDITRMRTLCHSLLGELEVLAVEPALVAQLGQAMSKSNDPDLQGLNDLYRKVASTSGRVDMVKKLVETMRIVVALEREAYGMDLPANAGAEMGNAITQLLQSMRHSSLPVVEFVDDDDDLCIGNTARKGAY